MDAKFGRSPEQPHSIHGWVRTSVGVAALRDLGPEDIEDVVAYWYTSGDQHLDHLGIDRTLLGTVEHTRQRMLRAVRTGDPDQRSLAFAITVDGVFAGYTLLNRYTPTSTTPTGTSPIRVFGHRACRRPFIHTGSSVFRLGAHGALGPSNTDTECRREPHARPLPARRGDALRRTARRRGAPWRVSPAIRVSKGHPRFLRETGGKRSSGKPRAGRAPLPRPRGAIPGQPGTRRGGGSARHRRPALASRGRRPALSAAATVEDRCKVDGHKGAGKQRLAYRPYPLRASGRAGDEMGEITGGALIARCLANENIRFVFGLPCPEVDPLLAALDENSVRFFPVRHEAAGGPYGGGALQDDRPSGCGDRQSRGRDRPISFRA